MSRWRVSIALTLLALALFSTALLLRPNRAPRATPNAPVVGPTPPPSSSAADPPMSTLPAGGVELTFLGPDPVPGVEAILEGLAEPPRRSGPDGRITWDRVPPGSAHRWKIVSAHRRFIDRTREPGFDLQQQLFSPWFEMSSLSGSFEVKPGEVTRITAKIVLPGSVVGCVEWDPSSAAKGEVHLLHHAGDRQFVRESVIRTGDAGLFRFAEAAPGKKAVEAWWETKGTFSFASIYCDVHPGQETRLPPLKAQEGHLLRGIVHLVGKEALPPGTRVEDLRAEVHFGFGGPGRRGSFVLSVPLDTPFTFTGLNPGRTLFAASILKEIPGIHWRNSFGLQFYVPETSEFALYVQAQAQIPVRLTCNFPKGQPPGPLEAYIVPDRESEDATLAIPEAAQDSIEQELAVRLPSIPPSGQASFSTRAGTFHVWVFSALPDRKAGQNYFGEGKVTVVPGQTNALTVDLGPGAILTGRIRNSKGEGYYSNICVKCPPFDAYKDVFLREVVSDDRGFFRMTGVPPGRVIEVWRADRNVLIGPADTETTVDLTLDR